MKRVKNIYTGTHVVGYDTKIIELLDSRFAEIYKLNPDSTISGTFNEALNVIKEAAKAPEIDNIGGDGFIW